MWFLNFTTHRENKVKILSKKVRDTQPNPRYSVKNNVAIRMIATFIPTTSFDLFTSTLCYLLQEKIANKIKYKLTIINMDPAVSLFLNTGVVHSTDKSHRAAAKAYSAFLTKEVKSRQKLRIPFSRAQIKAVRT